MKKVVTRVLSVLLVVVILATSLPLGTLAAAAETQNNQNITTDMGDMSITATNSFGEMLTESISDQTSGQDNGCYISNIEYEGYCARVSFVTQQDCTIRVAVYEENTGRMVTSVSADVLACETEVVVEFEDELPDYFVLKAFMLDENVAPLCKAYTCNEKTKMYEDFLATTVEDFPEDKVINLDEDKKNNFLVMSNKTITVTTDDKTNVLLSYDEAKGVYKFGNIDNQIKSLKKGDIFYFDNGNVEELTFIKVGAIDITLKTAEITEAETSMEEIFDIVKIYNDIESDDFVIDEDDKLDDGVTYLGATEIVKPSTRGTYAIDGEEEVVLQHNYKLDEQVKPSQPKKIGEQTSLTGSISFEGSAGFSVTSKFKYYISQKFSEVEFTLTPSIFFDVTIEGVGRLEVELMDLDYSPCVGVYVGISPKFIVEASVKLVFTSTLEFTLGFGYTSDNGFVNKSKKPSFKPELEMEGEIFVGVDLAPRVYVAHEKVAKIELGSEIGGLLTAKRNFENDPYHKCYSCLDGEIDLVGELTGSLIFGDETKWEKKLKITFLNIKIDIADFYYSSTYSDFGWGECPHYKTIDWSYNEALGTLTIKGTGPMDDYKSNERPWEAYEDDITTVIIGKGITSIGKNAFYSCSNLTSVTIPDTVTTIGASAFSWCSSLTEITIPDSVTTIGTSAFYYCRGITSLTIPDSITTIGDNAFNLCTSLTNVIIPNSVITIGKSAFKDCTKLTSIIIGNGVATIDSEAFSNCTSLTRVIIGNNVKTIGSSAFYFCSSLTSVTIPDGVTTIGEAAFSRTALSSITIPNSVTSIGNSAFYGVNFTSVEIPSSVTTINDTTFYYCRNLKSVTIPDSVTAIGKNAFANCENLESVIIPDSVKIVDDKAFYYCSNLKSVTIGDGVTSVGEYAFDLCINMTYLELGEGLTTIESCAFRNCKNLTELIIPDSVITIGSDAFLNDIKLKNVIIGKNVKTINSGAFEDCESIESIVIPDSVTTIGSEAFDCCIGLKSVTIGRNATSIGYHAFYGCENLTSVAIGRNVTQISAGAFKYCRSLKSVTIPDGVTIIQGETFYSCSSLESITIPDSVEAIGDFAIAHCDKLANVYYTGTQEQWNGISIGIGNDSLSNATIHYGSARSVRTLNSNQRSVNTTPLANITSDIAKYTTTAENAINSNEYVVLVLKNTVDIGNYTDSDILYMDQKTAESDGNITFNYVPKADEECVVYIIGIFSDADSTQHKQVSSTVTTEPETPDEPEYNYTFSIQSPSLTTIRHKDGIKLHANIEGNIPDGCYVEWTADNDKFKMEEIEGGNGLQIISDKNGYTVFTATLYSEDGEILATDTIEMRSKAGFFDKIGSFFRSLFGSTKIYEY